jgi:hypothetical protein
MGLQKNVTFSFTPKQIDVIKILLFLCLFPFIFNIKMHTQSLAGKKIYLQIFLAKAKKYF